MNQRGEFKPYLVSWVADRLGVSRITMAHRWCGEIVRTAPEPPVPIPLVRMEVSPEEGGAYGITNFYYEGQSSQSESIEDQVVYEFQGSFNQEPITSHPRIGELLKKYGGKLVDGEIEWPEKPPEGTKSKRGFTKSGAASNNINLMYGVQSYLAIGAVWSVTRLYNKSDIPDSILNGIGEIVERPPGSPPTPAGRNWLKMSPTSRQRGNVLEVSENYMLSGIGGWITDVYNGSDISGA